MFMCLHNLKLNAYDSFLFWVVGIETGILFYLVSHLQCHKTRMSAADFTQLRAASRYLAF
jgi:hypothetical protein